MAAPGLQGLLDLASKNKKWAATLSLVAASIAGFLQFDSYYAHASDVNDLKRVQQQAVVEQRLEIRYSSDQIRKQYLEDKLFELSLKPTPSTVDRAMREKYQRDLDQINSKWKDR